MELHLNDHNLRLPSTFSVADSYIPSFEEAFDTESLKKFYRRQDSFTYSLKESVEEDTRSQTLEPFSPMTPMTPAQSHNFMDYFHVNGKDSWQDMFGRSSQGVDKAPSEQLFCQRSQSQGIQGLMGVENASQQPKSKGDDAAQDMITKLCMEMQEYYKDPAAKERVEALAVRPVQQQQQIPLLKKMNSQTLTEKKTFYALKEEELNNKVMKKLIQKKSIFKIQRKKVPQSQTHQAENSIMKNNLQQVKPQKKIAIEFMTQALPMSNPLAEFQGNFVNQETREKISFQLGPQMNFNMGNGDYNRNNMRMPNMNIKTAPQSLLKYLS